MLLPKVMEGENNIPNAETDDLEALEKVILEITRLKSQLFEQVNGRKRNSAGS